MSLAKLSSPSPVSCVHACMCVLVDESMGTFAMLDVLREFDTLVEVILPHLPTSFKAMTEEDGKSALIWILGEYGEV